MFKSIIMWALDLFSSTPAPVPALTKEKEPGCSGECAKKRKPAAKKTAKPVVRKRAVTVVERTRPKKVK
jgi:hypothetical protein